MNSVLLQRTKIECVQRTSLGWKICFGIMNNTVGNTYFNDGAVLTYWYIYIKKTTRQWTLLPIDKYFTKVNRCSLKY